MTPLLLSDSCFNYHRAHLKIFSMIFFWCLFILARTFVQHSDVSYYRVLKDVINGSIENLVLVNFQYHYLQLPSSPLELIEKYPYRCRCDFRTGSDGIWGTQRVPKWPQNWWVNTLMKDNLAILCRIAPLRCSTTLITWLDRKCLWQPVKSVFIFFSLQTLSWVVGWFCDPDLPQGPLICCMLCSRLWYQ